MPDLEKSKNINIPTQKGFITSATRFLQISVAYSWIRKINHA